MKIKKLIEKLFPKIYQELAARKRAKIIAAYLAENPNTNIYETIDVPEKIINYSQHNQDYIIFNSFFKNKINGFYCDIGASHPLTYNNTRLFEENGWLGIAFDPLPGMNELWEKYRKTKFYNLAVSDHEGKVDFSVVDSDGELGNIHNMHSHMKVEEKNSPKFDEKTISVEAVELKKIFFEENISHIDYMSIDVEGHELKVLHGIDWDLISINVISIENNNCECRLTGDSRIREFMHVKGYSLFGRILGLDDIYARNDFLERNSSIKNIN